MTINIYYQKNSIASDVLNVKRDDSADSKNMEIYS